MSFQKFTDLESDGASVRSARYKDFPEFDTLSQALENSLYDINNNQLPSLRSLLQQFESLLEDHVDAARVSKLATRISDGVTHATTSFKKLNQTTAELNEYLNQCERNHEDEDTVKYLRQKEALLINLMKLSIGQFQKFQKTFHALQQRRTPVDEPHQSDDPPSESQHQVQITYEPINAEELEQQTLLIQEREREIHQITQDTQEINDIFLNLQDIVHEQQFTIDTIESNIINFASNTKGASHELRRAERYQRRANGRMACCFLILVGVLGSVILIGLIF